MKVVLFCGGQGLRIRDYDMNTPKPMVPVGYRPIIWHLMRYYAHYGHNEFILCLGHRADVIKNYFLNYDECLTNDFVLHGAGRGLKMINTDIHDWKISFVDTGIESHVGQRLRRVREYLENDETFLVNYSDGLSDVPLDQVIDHHKKSGRVASFLAVHPATTFHTVRFDEQGEPTGLHPADHDDLWINGGFMTMQREIFDYLGPNDDIVSHVFPKLIRERKLNYLKWSGFWACMDTFKEKTVLDDLVAKGNAPWEVWKRNPKPDANRPSLKVG